MRYGNLQFFCSILKTFDGFPSFFTKLSNVIHKSAEISDIISINLLHCSVEI